MENTTKWNILGITDDSSTCELCGKKGLKKVVVLENIETLEEIRVGCDCAGYLTTGKKTRSNTEIVKSRALVVRAARKWLAAGHPVNTVVKGIGNCFGYGARYSNGTITISDFATIKVD